MKVTVRLTGPLVRTFGFSAMELDLPEAALTADLLTLLGVGPTPPRIVTRAGQGLAPGDPLRDGDRVVISPIYSGG